MVVFSLSRNTTSRSWICCESNMVRVVACRKIIVHLVILAGTGAVVLGSGSSSHLPAASLNEAPFSQGHRALGVQGEQYGVLAATHPMAQRVEGIFVKLLRVSGKRPGAVFEAYVLNTPKILVQALPGGAVVISRGAVDLTGRDDNGLAFLLAHEVAHVIRDHHGLLGSYHNLAGGGPAPPAGPGKDEQARTLQAMELEADRLGLLFASLAGYRVGAAIPILQKVISQTGSSPFHPEPRQRAEELAVGIRQIAAHVQLFYLGLAYLTSRHYEEAARIYETFASLYPSREVYNNLGVAYHKRALLYKRGDGFVKSVMVESQTRAQATLKDITEQPPATIGVESPLFRRYLDSAVSAYRLAVESDPEYAAGHNNLGLAYMEAGEYDFAIGEFKRALRLEPGMKMVWNNRGVAYFMNGDLPRAREDFLQAIATDPKYPDPHANLAILYLRQGRKDEAQRRGSTSGSSWQWASGERTTRGWSVLAHSNSAWK